MEVVRLSKIKEASELYGNAGNIRAESEVWWFPVIRILAVSGGDSDMYHSCEGWLIFKGFQIVHQKHQPFISQWLIHVPNSYNQHPIVKGSSQQHQRKGGTGYIQLAKPQWKVTPESLSLKCSWTEKDRCFHGECRHFHQATFLLVLRFYEEGEWF